MNKLKHNLLTGIVAGAVCAIFALASAQASAIINPGFFTAGQADQSGGDRYAWTVYCKTLALTSYRDPEFSIKPVVEAKISCAPPEVPQATAYMDYWYGADEQGLCLGAKTHSTLTIPQGQNSLSIHILGNQSTSPAELNAATDAVVRLILDFKLHDYWIQGIFVPDEAFDSVCGKFAFYNIRPTTDWSDQASAPVFGFLLRSESGKRSALMQYRQ